MLQSQILPLMRFRGRREQRRELSRALHASDRHRDRLLRHLWRALDLVAADRAGVVWIDEYGAGLVHPHVVLDVASDRPRRCFSPEFLRRSWGGAVPGTADAPDAARLPGDSGVDGTRSAFAVSLGSDGLHAWFMVVDSLTPRSPLGGEVVEELLFLAGECASVVLHRDLDAEEREERPAAWTVLRDAPDEGRAGGTGCQIACRFALARAVRAFLEDSLVAAPGELEERLAGVRNEISALEVDDPERRASECVLDAVAEGDPARLAAALLELAGFVEDRGQWHGAAEFLGAAREVAAAASAGVVWLDATRGLGRTHRKLGRWEEALRWYGEARTTARRIGEIGREARALDGVATVHINQGNLPAARRVLDEALPIAAAGPDEDARAAIFHSFMTVAHTEGRLEEAARWGWKAVREYQDREGRLRALTGLGGVFLEARVLDAAEDAFSLVSARVRDRTFRLYCLLGLAIVAARRGHREEYDVRLRRLSEERFEDGPPELHAEVLLECGDGFLALGDEAEAKRWYHRAVDVAEKAGVNEYLIRAEEAIQRLGRVARRDATEAVPTLPSLETGMVEEIRTGLGRLREGAL